MKLFSDCPRFVAVAFPGQVVMAVRTADVAYDEVNKRSWYQLQLAMADEADGFKDTIVRSYVR